MQAKLSIALTLLCLMNACGAPIVTTALPTSGSTPQPADATLPAATLAGAAPEGPTATLDAGPAPDPLGEAAGELYFYVLPHQPGQPVQLVRLPGTCVDGSVACPPLEVIAVPFAFVFNVNALAWSPNGALAALAYPDNALGTPYKLWLFDPAAKTWTARAEFPFIDPPFWSADGQWLAFRAQDGKGGENIHVVHPDGTGLKNLTSGVNLPVEPRPYVIDGWLTDEIIVRSALPGKEGTVYLVRAPGGETRPLASAPRTRSALVPSSDGAWLAYDDYDSQSQQHLLRAFQPDGAGPFDLASIAGGSLYPIVWAPDGLRLAFAHSAFDSAGNASATVYLIGREGGLTPVYHGVTVGRVLFSPDGKYLLVEETVSATGGHLYVVNLETLEARILQAPGLSLESDWYAPSWRP
jgi:Tol biopolymer transport system component